MGGGGGSKAIAAVRCSWLCGSTHLPHLGLGLRHYWQLSTTRTLWLSLGRLPAGDPHDEDCG